MPMHIQGDLGILEMITRDWRLDAQDERRATSAVIDSLLRLQATQPGLSTLQRSRIAFHLTTLRASLQFLNETDVFWTFERERKVRDATQRLRQDRVRAEEYYRTITGRAAAPSPVPEARDGVTIRHKGFAGAGMILGVAMVAGLFFMVPRRKRVA